MKPGTQADVIRELKNEHEINCSRAAISKLYKDKDYRIVKTPGGKIKIQETVKALIDSGFGSRSKKLNEPDAKPQEEPPHAEDVKKLNGKFDTGKLDDGEIPAQADSKKVKEYYAALREKLKWQREDNEVIDAEEAKLERFETSRKIRDNLLNIPGRIKSKCVGKTAHEIDQILEAEIKTALFSVIGE